MVKSQLSKIVCLLMALLVFAAGFAGCSTTVAGTSTPALPAGFDTTTVPDVDLSGYIYLNQGSPITILTDFLPEEFSLANTSINIESAQLWLGGDTDSVGGAVTLSTEASAKEVAQLVNSYKVPVLTFISGKIIYATNVDSGQWTDSLKNALGQQLMVNPVSKYPAVATDFAFFPANPPSNPFAAGFIDLNSSLVESVSSSLGISDYLTSLKSAQIDRICCVAYSAQPVKVSSETITAEYINSYQSSLLAVGRSSYPDAAISIFFGDAMSSAGFVKYTVNNVELYEYPIQGAAALVAHKGSVIYAAVAQTKEVAEKLLLSCF